MSDSKIRIEFLLLSERCFSYSKRKKGKKNEKKKQGQKQRSKLKSDGINIHQEAHDKSRKTVNTSVDTDKLRLKFISGQDKLLRALP